MDDKYYFKTKLRRLILPLLLLLAGSAASAQLIPFYSAANDKYGYKDASGKEVVAPKYDFTWHFIGGYAAVKSGKLFGFIDKSGKEVIPPRYEEANNFHGACCYKGMAHVKENGKWKIVKL